MISSLLLYVFCVFNILASSWASSPTISDSRQNCASSINSYSITCLKLDLASWVDKLDGKEQYSVLPGVSVIREDGNSSKTSRGLRFNNTKDNEEGNVDVYLIKKISDYFETHTIRFDLLPGNQEEFGARKGGGSGSGGYGGGGGGGKKGGKKGGGGMGMILAMGAMMKGTMMAMGMAGLAMMAGKALMTGMIALVLSAIVALKGLSKGDGGKSTTYEVVAKPVYEDHGGHSSSWGRKFNYEPLPLLGLHPQYKPAT